MAVTGRTGADAYSKAVKKQAQLIAKFGPKLTTVAATCHTLGLITDAEYAALVAGFNAVPQILSAVAKVAEYSGF